jgi:ureidoacrylate peracid hydrolase
MTNMPNSLLATLSARLDPRHSAVVVIDMQNDFCAQGGYVEKVVGRDTSPCRAVVAPVGELVVLARGRPSRLHDC